MRMTPHADLKSKWLVAVVTPLLGMFLLALMTAPNAPVWVVLGIVIGSSTVACAFYFHFLKEFQRVTDMQEQSFKEGYALDHTSTFIMIVDEKRRIRYCNHALLKFFRKHEDKFSKINPNFHANHMVGESLDAYVPDSLAIKTICANLSSRYVQSISMAEFNFDLALVPIVNENDKRLGIMIEWQNAQYGAQTNEPADAAATVPADNQTFPQTVLVNRPVAQEIQFDVSEDFAHKIATTLDKSAEILVIAIDALVEKTKSLQAATQIDAAEFNDKIGLVQDLKTTLVSSKEKLGVIQNYLAQVDTEMQLTQSELNISQQSLTQLQGTTDRVQKMCEVVDSIALQTHVLSLNAAVESARAGEHGKGFALVSNDARELARYSADLVNEIKQSIHSHTTQVENTAVAMAAQVGGMEKIHMLFEEAKMVLRPLDHDLESQDITLGKTVDIFGQISKTVTDRFITTQQIQMMTSDLTFQVKGLLEVMQAVKNRFTTYTSITSNENVA